MIHLTLATDLSPVNIPQTWVVGHLPGIYKSRIIKYARKRCALSPLGFKVGKTALKKILSTADYFYVFENMSGGQLNLYQVHD